MTYQSAAQPSLPRTHTISKAGRYFNISSSEIDRRLVELTSSRNSPTRANGHSLIADLASALFELNALRGTSSAVPAIGKEKGPERGPLTRS
ncbi:BQ5605_C015g07920 [Microbotryum silenes-dioicae]|uniref:BQ5605_C015g07920 protein n=1 Tax=Microbotryum silenes-dioicae TaxID=796604 RepID=A0A2X0LT64_9BASI|nr:BQ5605_C015g07920 [Microbotryum silenes-dioicae]